MRKVTISIPDSLGDPRAGKLIGTLTDLARDQIPSGSTGTITITAFGITAVASITEEKED